MHIGRQSTTSVFSICIRGTFHDNFPGFSGFKFCRKLAGTKPQQGTDKASKHNRFTVFSRTLVFWTHQQKWRQFFSFIVYPLYHNLCHIEFSPRYTGKNTDDVSAIGITRRFRRGLHHSQRCSHIRHAGAGPHSLSAVPQWVMDTQLLP